MANGQALEAGSTGGMMGDLSQPNGLPRRTLSYDDGLDTPMMSLPEDIRFNILWKRPVIPEKKSRCLSEGDEPPIMFKASASKPTIPVVKTKASSSILTSIMNKHTQDSIQRFEQKAGLTDKGYTPHKGLTAEETRYHCMAEALHKLKMPSGEFWEDKQRTSAQSTPSATPSATPTATPSVTPSVTPQASPRPPRRNWFGQNSLAYIPISEFDSGDISDVSSLMGGTEGGGGGGDSWSLFSTRPTVAKSSTDPESLSLQSCQGNQNSLEMMKTRVIQDPVMLKTPKIELPGLEVKKLIPRPHRLKPRDMNVLTPSGF